VIIITMCSVLAVVLCRRKARHVVEAAHRVSVDAGGWAEPWGVERAGFIRDVPVVKDCAVARVVIARLLVLVISEVEARSQHGVVRTDERICKHSYSPHGGGDNSSRSSDKTHTTSDQDAGRLGWATASKAIVSVGRLRATSLQWLPSPPISPQHCASFTPM
jgi:hypothetical protein